VADSSLISSLLPAVVYVNPNAGNGRALRGLPRIRKVFEAASVPAEFISVGSAKDLEANALAAIQSGKRLLFALGGDGTFQALANATEGSDVVLGILPAGGGNDFAAALRLPEDPVAAAGAILGGQPMRVDLARARTADGRVRLYLAGGGLGIDAEAARHANETFRWMPGRSRYIASALWAFSGVPGHRSESGISGVRLAADGSKLSPCGRPEYADLRLGNKARAPGALGRWLARCGDGRRPQCFPSLEVIATAVEERRAADSACPSHEGTGSKVHHRPALYVSRRWRDFGSHAGGD
jgi:hypothetical protein